MTDLKKLKRISEVLWEMPQEGDMHVPARFYGTDKIMRDMDDQVFKQIANVACLPGIQTAALCMPDAHSGYGFPIGGVAAFDPEEGGIISPGGIGFDINCGMRLLKTNLTIKEVQPKIKELVHQLFLNVPAGVGGEGNVALTREQLRQVSEQGAGWCVKNGYGWKQDLERLEEYGCLKDADASKISDRAIKRGINQLGTLGSGNHYLEVQFASPKNIFDEKIAKHFGITHPDQILVMVHCGSRGYGHQICSDFLKDFEGVMAKYKIHVRDRELACAPFNSPEGQAYHNAMRCAANFAFANRQVIIHNVRSAFEKVFSKDAESLGLDIIYDVAHNIAKLEKYKVDGKKKDLVVHRKGATRSFGPGNPALAKFYQETGQPVIVGGSMETGSYLLVGTKKAEEETFGSTMHGSGRTMSRTQAKQMVKGDQLQKDMAKKGIYVEATSFSGLAEEAGFAYKDINEVIRTMEIAGISKPVVQLKPIGNVKG